MTRGPYLKDAAKAPAKSLGARIRKVRLHWRWSQDRLAGELGTDQQAVSRWERGLVQPTSATLRAIQDLFGLTEDALLSGKGFHIPGLPQCIGSVRIAEAYARDLVALPELEGAEGKVVVMVRGSDKDAHQVMTKAKAREVMDRTTAAGKRIWLVIE